MSEHLSDQQLAGILSVEEDEAAASHLAACAICRAEHEKLASAIEALRRASLAAAEQPDTFWRSQRLAVAARLPHASEAPTSVLAWVTATAALVLAAVLLSQSALPGPSQSMATRRRAVQPSQPVDADHALLVDVERSVSRGVPRALEPATLIAQELDQAAQRKTDR